MAARNWLAIGWLSARIAFCSAVASAPAGLAWAADIGRVKQVEGAAFIERSGAQEPAETGATLKQQDTLVTGADGRIGVTFIDNSRFSAGPNSRVELSRFRFNATTHEGEFETTVQRGSLAIISGQIAKQTPDAMRVRTPTTILGVRGTKFVLQVD